MQSTRNLAKDGTPNSVQAFPLTPGRIALTSGTYTDVSLIQCDDDGTLTLTLQDDTTEDYNMVALTHVTVQAYKSVEIISGTFCLS